MIHKDSKCFEGVAEIKIGDLFVTRGRFLWNTAYKYSKGMVFFFGQESTHCYFPYFFNPRQIFYPEPLALAFWSRARKLKYSNRCMYSEWYAGKIQYYIFFAWWSIQMMLCFCATWKPEPWSIFIKKLFMYRFSPWDLYFKTCSFQHNKWKQTF